MKRNIITLICFIITTSTFYLSAQLSSHDAIKQMARGINIGNTMEAPNEGDWRKGNITENEFEDYKNAGFTAVRIPITWNAHTLTTSPYTINATWLTRVEQVVDWGLSKGLLIIINAHHEDWINTSYTSANKARFDSIWSQIAVRFKNKSDSLIFEIINEPNGLTIENVDDLNARVLSIIRKSNPTRLVSFSGNQWANSDQLVGAAIPDANDTNLIGYYHSYDPYPFGLNGPGTYGSASDLATTKAKFDQVTTWSTKHNIPVMLGEFGATKLCEYNSRMFYYATIVEMALEHDVAFSAWDDGGSFAIYNRSNRTFNEIKDILIHTYKESPTKLKAVVVQDSNILLTWTNRTPDNDSIIVDRKTGSSDFVMLRKLKPNDSSFSDSMLIRDAYYYRLRTRLKDSIDLYSYPVKVSTVKLAVNVITHSTNNLSIYPNPATDKVQVGGLIKNDQITVDIVDMLGKKVRSVQINASNPFIDLNGITRGVYFFAVKEKENTKILKVIIR